MTKRRAIYGTAATSLSLARCCPEAQLLFDRLITAADDQGRLQGDPLLVKAACMPLVDRATVRRVDGWLDELAAGGMIQRYEAGGQALIQIVKWWEHQDWMRHAYPSRWPAPRGWDDRLKGGGAPPDDGKTTADRRQDDGTLPASRGQDAGLSESESGDGGESELVNESQASVSGGESEPTTTATPVDIFLRKTLTTHFDQTGEYPNEKGTDMYRDLLRQFGPEVVSKAQWAVGPGKGYGYIGKVKTECKRLAA